MRLFHLALALPFFLVSTPALADYDAQLWTRLGVSKEVVKNLELGFDQNFRFDQNMTRVAAVMPAIGVDYRPARWLQLGGGYRLAYQRRRNSAMDFRHRLHVQGQVRTDVHTFRLRYRLRLQSRFRDERDPNYAIRNRISADWRGARPWIPGLALESNHRLGDPVQSVIFQKVRFTARLRYDFRDYTFGVFYRLEVPFLRVLDPTLHIAGVTVHWEL
jgi:hypothetical protein